VLWLSLEDRWACRSLIRNRLLLIFGSLFLYSPPGSASANFDYPDFSTSSGLNLVQSAVASGNLLILTPAAGQTQGAAWFSDRQFVQSGFESTFRFQISGEQHLGGGDGFVFVIQNQSPSAINTPFTGGSSLGYDGIPNSVAVEFDTFEIGGNFGDPNGNHISVHTRGILPNNVDEIYSVGNTGASLATNLSDGLVHEVVIRYLPGNLNILLDGSTTPALTVPINLSSTLSLDAGKAYVGFTSATGGSWERHDILSWSFRTIPEPSASFIAIFAIGLVVSVSRTRRSSPHD
jgi:peptide-N4-(N-acetyl-beta-glucosaminyl)asparagine amidase